MSGRVQGQAGRDGASRMCAGPGMDNTHPGEDEGGRADEGGWGVALATLSRYVPRKLRCGHERANFQRRLRVSLRKLLFSTSLGPGSFRQL